MSSLAILQHSTFSSVVRIKFLDIISNLAFLLYMNILNLKAINTKDEGHKMQNGSS
jgi:hypothetical protein